MSRLHILFLCNKSPWPAREGGPLAMNQLIEGLADAGNKVKVLAVSSEKYPADPDTIPEDYLKKTGIEFVSIDLAVKPVPAFYHLFTGKSYHVQRFISSAFEKKLTEVLQKENYDIVQMETLFMAPYLSVVRKYSKAKVILRAHNIEHLIWKRMALGTRCYLKKFYLRHLAGTLENYEKNVINRFDAVLPITENDARFFKAQGAKKVKTVPFGIHPQAYALPENVPEENALFHIGSMNWMPNQEGVAWFLKEVWPGLSARHSGLKFYLAGRAMPESLKKRKEKNLVVVGEVPDARSFIASKSISIAPLFSGSGVRIKIIESMALGKAVVATSTGAEGLDCTSGKDILIANTAGEFAEAVSFLYTHPKEAKKIGENARKLIRTKHNSADIIRDLERFYHKIL